MSGLTRRIEHGSGHRYELDGHRVEGVTTVINKGVAKPALKWWAANTVARYAVDHWAELARLPVTERLDRLKESPDSERDTQAVRGTKIHSLAQAYASDQEIEVAEELIGHVDAYAAFHHDWQPEVLLLEAAVGNRRRRYMGTLDLLARLVDGQLWLLDLKTTGSGVYPEAALQLAAYRHAEFYLDEEGNEVPMPEVDAAGVVWLRADGYDLFPADTSEETFHFFLHALQLARFADRAKTDRDLGHFIGGSMLPPQRLKEAS